MSILNLIRSDLLNSQNYVPGGEGALYRAHANELPWSPISQGALKLNFYPDSQSECAVQKELADYYQVDRDQIVLTRGSDDGIDLITRLFLIAGQDALMQFPPTFPMYAFYVRLQNAELIQSPVDASNNFSLSLDQINASWKPNCKVIMICSPNNPTANLVDLELIAAVCREYENRSLVVVDEAYIEFSDSQSATTLLSQFENLVVLRTLSKACGLAGIRLGAILAQAPVINAFKKIIAPFVLSSPVIDVAKNALLKKDWFESAINRIKEERNWLINELQSLPIIEKVYPTDANFILIKTSHSKEITEHLSQQGIAIRDFLPNSLLHQHLRITVGDKEQNQLLINLLSAFSVT